MHVQNAHQQLVARPRLGVWQCLLKAMKAPSLTNGAKWRMR